MRKRVTLYANMSLLQYEAVEKVSSSQFPANCFQFSRPRYDGHSFLRPKSIFFPHNLLRRHHSGFRTGLVGGHTWGKRGAFCLGSSIWEGLVLTLIQDTGFPTQSFPILMFPQALLSTSSGLEFLVRAPQSWSDCTWVLDKCNQRITEPQEVRSTRRAHFLSWKYQNPSTMCKWSLKNPTNPIKVIVFLLQR